MSGVARGITTLDKSLEKGLVASTAKSEGLYVDLFYYNGGAKGSPLGKKGY